MSNNNFQIKKEFERSKNDTKGYNFVCCLDGSKKAASCLKYAEDLACRENDKVMISQQNRRLILIITHLFSHLKTAINFETRSMP